MQPVGCRVVSGEDGKERDQSEVCSRKTRETESLHKGRSCLELKLWQDRVGLVDLCAARGRAFFFEGVWVQQLSPSSGMQGPGSMVCCGTTVQAALTLFSSFSSSSLETSSSLSWLPTSPGISPLLASLPGKSWSVSWLTLWPASTTEHPGTGWRGRVPALPQAALSTGRCPLRSDRL